MKKLGVIGTMVWDTIHGRRDSEVGREEWGGIAYALGALEVSLGSEWEIVPLVKVGNDLAPRANEFLGSLTRRSGATRFLEVPEPNNRVTLRYTSEARRTEQLRGGVPGWQWSELEPLVADLDAIYVNFISGWELDLETAGLLRSWFPGPIYCDLHSLLLGVGADGFRELRPLPEIAAWFGCFDVVQLNEVELSVLGPDPMALAAIALNRGVGLLVVTLSENGAAYFAAEEFNLGARDGRAGGTIRTRRVAAEKLFEGDPTGCGDVFGATLIAQLLQDVDLETAIGKANTLAGRNMASFGATNLHYHLRGEIAPR